VEVVRRVPFPNGLSVWGRPPRGMVPFVQLGLSGPWPVSLLLGGRRLGVGFHGVV